MMNGVMAGTEGADVWAVGFAFMLGLPRFGVALLVLPLLPPGLFPAPLRIGVAVGLLFVAYPVFAAAAGHVSSPGGWWLAFVLKEALIGGLIGYACSLVLWALTMAGEVIDNQVGFNNAQIFNPFLNHAAGPVAQFMAMFGVFVFVALSGLEVFLRLMYESLVLWPPGELWPLATQPLNSIFVQETDAMLSSAVRVAAPVIGALLLVELGLGLVNRIAPQFNVWQFSLPVKGLVATLMLALMMLHLVDAVKTAFSAQMKWLDALKALFGG
jgi:type III secretion protein T